jgi:hypothetical protein
LAEVEDFNSFLTENYKEGDRAEVSFIRYQEEMSTTLTLQADPRFKTSIKNGDKKALNKRAEWLSAN